MSKMFAPTPTSHMTTGAGGGVVLVPVSLTDTRMGDVAMVSLAGRKEATRGVSREGEVEVVQLRLGFGVDAMAILCCICSLSFSR